MTTEQLRCLHEAEQELARLQKLGWELSPYADSLPGLADQIESGNLRKLTPQQRRLIAVSLRSSFLALKITALRLNAGVPESDA
ncbi:hypothetical protein [Planctomicrobium sp. SH664]|uniref:hypothetical protein n=1 Tax=Planctomicrobium sp. SH664 TaxID=3448125 RepID=UPI003F5C598A